MLPRNIRRAHLKTAIKEGKRAFEAGLEEGRKIGREEGFRQGCWITTNRILTAAFQVTYE